ncbi:hypothetical protein SH661x_001796 [Planctomicrobium sp. SH661]|uniref:hypothetical protein n=1 Tax=Planctomicrobium sp. SH661 TaxID=3448124 RepID=UPI003F5C38DE
MSFLGKTLVVDCGEAGAEEFICVADHIPGKLLLVKTRGMYAAFMPVECDESRVVAAVDAPMCVRRVMFDLAAALTFEQVLEATPAFRKQCYRTIDLLKVAFDRTHREGRRFTKQSVVTVGPSNLRETFIVLEDNGEFMQVVTEDGAVVEIKRSDWVFGEAVPGIPVLVAAAEKFPDAWILREYLNRWKQHTWN